MPNTVARNARKLEPGAYWEGLIVDLGVNGGPVFFFHNYQEQGSNTFVFQGHTYGPLAWEAEGFDFNPKGTQPRPKIRVANIDGQITQYLRQYDNFVGCQVTRKRTYVEFLDTLPDGSHPSTANPNEEFPPDIFTIDRRTAETNVLVEFELTAKWDVFGVLLPRRQILATYCPWAYRGEECGYTGPPVSDANDNPLTATTDRGAYNPVTVYANHDYTYIMLNGIRQYYVSLANTNTAPLTDMTKWTRDICSKKLLACKARFGANNPLPYGGYPGANRIPR